MGGIRRRAGKKKGNNVKNKREAGQPGNYKDIVRENEMYSKFFAKQGSDDIPMYILFLIATI